MSDDEGERKTIKGMKTLKTTSEGGTKLDFEDFKDKISNYFVQSKKNGADIAHLISEREDPIFKEPVELTDDEEKKIINVKRYERQVKTFFQREEQYESNKQTLFSIIWENVSEETQDLLMSRKGYRVANAEKEPIWMLQNLHSIIEDFDDKKHILLSLDDMLERIIRMRQGDKSVKDFIRIFRQEYKTYKEHGGSFLDGEAALEIVEKRLTEAEEDTPFTDDKEKEKERERIAKDLEEEIEAFAMFKRADKKRFGNLQIKLKNSYLLGRNEYPTTVQELTKLLKNYEQEWQATGDRLPRQGTALLQEGSSGSSTGSSITYLKSTTGTFFPNITCSACNLKGHYKSHCPVVDCNGSHLDGAGFGTLRDAPAIEEALEASRNRNRRQRPQGGRGNGSGTGTSTGNGTGATGGSEVSSDGSFPFCFTNISDTIDPNWLLLDSESNVNLFCNPNLVNDISQVTDGETLLLSSNGGTQDSDRQAKFGDMTVWFNTNSLANILSLSLVAEHFRVTMDTFVDNSFLVHLNDNVKLKFTCHENGLYYCDTKSILKDDLHTAFSFFQNTFKQCKGKTFLQTVEENKKKYTQREIRKADEARALSTKLCHPEQTVLERMIKANVLQNCKVTIQDVKRAEKIYGKSIPATKGRSRRTENERLPSRDPIQIPRQIVDDYNYVTLCADYFYVNGVAVFHAISRDLKHRFVGFPDSRSGAQMLVNFRKVDQLYSARGFRINIVHADPEFEKIRDEIRPMELIVCEAGAHVKEAERSIQTIKNGCRSQTHAMPYRAIPRVMTRALVRLVNNTLNGQPERDGYKGATARNIIDNLPHIDCNELKYEFGSYVQLHIHEQFTNTMRQRTIDAIILDPTSDGKYKFMSLETGREVDGTVKSILPITDAIINKVESLAQNQGIALNPSRMLAFEWRPGQPFEPDDVPNDDVQDIPLILPEATLPVLAHNAAQGAVQDQDQGAQGAIQDQDQGAVQDQDQGAQEIGAETDVEDDDDDDLHSDDRDEETAEEVVVEEVIVEDVNEDEEDEEEYEESESEEESEERKEERQRRSEHFKTNTNGGYGRGQRKKLKRKFSFLQKRFENMKEREQRNFASFAWQEYKDTGDKRMLERCVTGFVFAQLSAKEGRKRYGKDADMKLMEEFQQLLDYDAFFPREASSLSAEAKKGAAGMINIIEEKTNRGHTPENPVLKGRSVFDGRKQRFMYTKEETASPTCSIDAFFLSCIIDGIEQRDTAMADVKGAYLNALMDDEVIMKIIGKDVDIFCELREDFKKFVVVENGIKVLYVQLYKALYGCVKSALLWYEMFTEHLVDMGFQVNPYDMCVANAMIDGKQCTITWYVDDTKISHKDPKVVDVIIDKIEAKFGKMKVVRGLIHEFLGMDIEFKRGKEAGKVSIGMKKHILKALEMFLDDITRDAATPATPYLFKNRGAKDLDEERADNFHSVTALLLFVSRRSRPDIQTAIAYLCTRVARPNEDDWKKLKRVLQYLRGTIDLVLTLGADDIANMQAWVDVAYAVHEDCKSHTGGVMSWGWGVVLSMCKKQKLNTKSSTEGEIVGVSDYLPNVIWGRMFLEAQGYKIKENVLYQDNQAAMKILKNGKASSGQKTKHMDARYFFIKDRCETEGIDIRYCPTEIMIADFFTKPLQGNLFRKFRDVILGYVHIRTLFHDDEQSSSQERVSMKKMGGHCRELNDIHNRHEGEKENVVMERKHRHFSTSISPVTSQYVNRQYTVASLPDH